LHRQKLGAFKNSRIFSIFCRSDAYNDGLIFDDLRAIQNKNSDTCPPTSWRLCRAGRAFLFAPHSWGSGLLPALFLTPPPKVIANVCMDMTCHIRGAQNLQGDALKQRFGGMSKKDVDHRRGSCLGQCDGAPAIAVNGHSYRNVSAPQAEALILLAWAEANCPIRKCRAPPEGSGGRSVSGRSPTAF
jgi:(2Fe-2S) ferredoxin